MMISPLQFRKATPADAPFLARHVLEALHWEMFGLPLTDEKQKAWRELTEVCRLPDTLYSYAFSTIALLNGEAAGMVVAYDGGGYEAMRRNTFSRITVFDAREMATMPDETKRGEFYIDSLSVEPTCRGKGVGRGLLLNAVEQAKVCALPAVLLVDDDNRQARRLYASVGFEEEGEVRAFGQQFLRMVHATDASAKVDNK
ncbi:GNAT family N-acetyltransferase [Alloprevotella sp. OH1205_COT-284]|nr:GNAT family N-acetyltransferase [Alloprevotella sp. OH1205_COT-284]